MKLRDATAAYYGMISEIDVWVGTYLDKLEAAGVDDNTLIIFTSDHGKCEYFAGCYIKCKLHCWPTATSLRI